MKLGKYVSGRRVVEYPATNIFCDIQYSTNYILARKFSDFMSNASNLVRVCLLNCTNIKQQSLNQL